MTTLNTQAIIEDGRLKIDLPTSLPSGKVDVQIQVTSSEEKPRGTDIQAIMALAGKLQWKGDPMKLQREMRDEWPD